MSELEISWRRVQKIKISLSQELVAHTCNPSYLEDKEDRVEGQPEQIVWETPKYWSKMDWRHGLSGRAPAL
jgi:hypothetical protein